LKIKYFLVDISCLHFITGILDCAVERKKNPELQAAERKKWRKLGHLADEIRDRKERGI